MAGAFAELQGGEAGFAFGSGMAAIHAALVLSVAGWCLYERETLPRLWVLTAGVDPQLPIRGRYADLRLVIDLRGSEGALQEAQQQRSGQTMPRAEGGKLVGDLLAGEQQQSQAAQHVIYDPQGGHWLLWQPLAFFLSEHEPDPTILADGEELWAEVTLPPRGPARPIRLEVREAAAVAAPAQ